LLIYITQVRLATGRVGHEHITDVKWRNPSSGELGQSTRAAMVDWINEGGVAKVADFQGHDVSVVVVNSSPPYIRTHADGVWTDNLLALPRF
jgi:copper oxidase (laccase) domain-containing protein